MRLLRLFSKFSVPGWFLLLWAVLAELHEANFALELWHKLSRSIEGHLFWAVGLGFVWLTLVVLWPSIKEHFPASLIPKTQHERLHNLENVTIPNLQHEFRESVKDHTTLHTANQILHNESLKPIQERLRNIEALNLRSVLQQLDHNVKSLTQNIQEVPRYIEVSTLVEEAGAAVETFVRIQELYPESVVSTNPFSNWRPFAGTTDNSEDIVAGVLWARSLEFHLDHIGMFTLKRGMDPGSLGNAELLGYVAHWRTAHENISGDLCLKLLREHYTALRNQQQLEAAGFRQEARSANI